MYYVSISWSSHYAHLAKPARLNYAQLFSVGAHTTSYATGQHALEGDSWQLSLIRKGEGNYSHFILLEVWRLELVKPT